jgi:hypothetical protein
MNLNNCDSMSDTEYKSVSIPSVVALVTSVVGVTSFLVLAMLVFATASIFVAVSSIWKIRRYNLSGVNLAVISLYISGGTLVLAPAWHYYLFNSESLPGHIRVDFAAANVGQSTALDAYANKPICLKGYLLAPSQIPSGKFQLSPDGDYRNAENTVTVMLPFKREHFYFPVAVSGILIVNPNAKETSQRYILTAEAMHRSRTSHGLVPRVPGPGC